MTRVSAGLIAAMFTLPLAHTALAQMTKEVQGEMTSITATVEAVNASTRTVTLKGPKGNYVDVVAPDTVKFAAIKVGDKITARYYDNIVLRLKAPGEKSVDTGSQAVTGGAGAKPGGTASRQRTITATITELDMSVPSVTFSGPNNWKYSSRVQDKEALSKVKVGDKVDITWTEALLISFEPEKK